MIDSAKTLELFGYCVEDLTYGSRRKIICRCDDCGRERVVVWQCYRELCISCVQKGKTLSKDHRRKIGDGNRGKIVSEETGRKISEANKNMSEETRRKIGAAHKGMKHTEEARRKMSESLKGRVHSEETRRKIGDGNRGKFVTEETCMKISASHQNIAIDEWAGYITDKPYCDKFNETCREKNRKRYNRECFICGKPEEENITKFGKQKKLAVHHIDMNKDQGCNDHQWNLIPVCMGCHLQLHTPTWVARLQYLLGTPNTGVSQTTLDIYNRP